MKSACCNAPVAMAGSGEGTLWHVCTKCQQACNVKAEAMTSQQERHKWALETAAALLQSDMDCFDLDEFDDEEQERRQKAVREIARSLQSRADKIGRVKPCRK